MAQQCNILYLQSESCMGLTYTLQYVFGKAVNAAIISYWYLVIMIYFPLEDLIAEFLSTLLTVALNVQT